MMANITTLIYWKRFESFTNASRTATNGKTLDTGCLRGWFQNLEASLVIQQAPAQSNVKRKAIAPTGGDDGRVAKSARQSFRVRRKAIAAKHEKYQRLLDFCKALPPTPTAVAHPSALSVSARRKFVVYCGRCLTVVGQPLRRVSGGLKELAGQ